MPTLERRLTKVKIEEITVPEIRASANLPEEAKAFMQTSVEKYGVLQPILLRPKPEGGYELIAGKTRLEEQKNQGLTEVEAFVLEAGEKDALVMHLIENWARGSTDPVSEAQVCEKFLNLGGSIEELAGLLGHTPEWVKLRLIVLKLPEVYKNALRDGKLKIGHIHAVLDLPNPQEIDYALDTALKLNWNVKTLEYFVERRLTDLETAKALSGEATPPPLPTETEAKQIVTHFECTGCKRAMPRTTQKFMPLCEECFLLVQYVTDQLGPPKQAMQRVYEAITTMQKAAASYPQLLQTQPQETQPVQTPVSQPTTQTPTTIPEKPQVIPNDKERQAAKKLLKQLIENL